MRYMLGGLRLWQTVHVSLGIAVLFLNYFLAQYDKFILSYFQASVIKTLSLSGARYALLSGYSTGIVFALLALPVAFVADYTSARVWTLTVASLWWSLCMIFQGLAKNFADFYCARLGMGIGQAAVEALSVSLISDLVGWRNVFIGESIFYVGVYVGEAVSGQIATSFARTGTNWQVAMQAIGITGIVIAVVLRLVLREPARNRSAWGNPGEEVAPSATDCQQGGGEKVGNDEPPPNLKRADLFQHQPVNENLETDEHIARKSRKTMFLRSISSAGSFLVRLRSFWLLALSAGMRQLAGNVFGYYMPGYLSAEYGSIPDLLSRYGIIVGTVGSASVLASGLLTSLLWHRTKLTPIYLTSIGGMISSIFVLLMIFSKQIADGNEQQGIKILYGCMAAAYITAETWLGCLSALLALLFLPEYKTFGLAIWGSIQVLIYSSGPEIIGLATRNVAPTSPQYLHIVKVCLAVIIPVGYWFCGLGMLLCIPLVRSDLGETPKRSPSTARKVTMGTLLAILILLVIVLFVLSLVSF